MNAPEGEYSFFAGLAILTIILSAVTQSPAGYLNILLVIALALVLYMTRTWKDRGFYLACAASPLVAACGMANPVGGLVAGCMSAGIFCSVLGLLSTREDLNLFAAFCVISLLITILIAFSNHVILPLAVLGTIAALVLGIQSVRMYQLKKHYAGAAA